MFNRVIYCIKLHPLTLRYITPLGTKNLPLKQVNKPIFLVYHVLIVTLFVTLEAYYSKKVPNWLDLQVFRGYHVLIVTLFVTLRTWCSYGLEIIHKRRQKRRKTILHY